MLTFEYRNAFIALPYKTVTTGLVFRSKDETTDPDIHAFLQDPETLAILNQHGRDGWELVNVQQITRGHDRVGNQNAQGWAFGYPLTTGFLLFLKRQLADS